jgi:Cysteine rich repeat
MSRNSVIALCAGLLALVAAPIAAPAQNAPPPDQGAPPGAEQTAPPGPGQMGPSGPGSGAMAACRPDLAQFCGGLQPGGGRIRACIREHFAQLSPGCKQALMQARMQRQQQQQQQ